MTHGIESMDGMVQLVLHADALERILRRFPLLTASRLPSAEEDLPTYSLVPGQVGSVSAEAADQSGSQAAVTGVAAGVFRTADAAAVKLVEAIGSAEPEKHEAMARGALRQLVPDLLTAYADALSDEAAAIRDHHGSRPLTGPQGFRYTNCLIAGPVVSADARAMRGEEPGPR